MHQWSVSEHEYARHDRRRGRRHADGPIDADQTALVVVDMVRFFVTEGSLADEVAARINESADRLRSAGGSVACRARPSRAGASSTSLSDCRVFDAC